MVAKRVDKAPALDGDGADEAWAGATAHKIGIDVPARLQAPRESVALKAVHDGANVYFLLQWKDSTKSDEHKPWTWSEIRETYAAGSEVEDAAFLAFERKGPFNVHMLAGIESEWDVWQWKAARTNPAGFAMDKRHVYTRKDPGGKAVKVRCLDGKDGWIQRPEDAGRSATKKHPQPTDKKGPKAPQYEAQEPDGSAADVRAKGSWKDGVWTVEFARKLSTGREDDAAFDPKKGVGFAVGILRETEDDEHLCSMPWTLKFGE